MTNALLVLAIIAVVLGATGVLLVLRHRTHLRRAAATRADFRADRSVEQGRTPGPATGRIRAEGPATGRIRPEPSS